MSTKDTTIIKIFLIEREEEWQYGEAYLALDKAGLYRIPARAFKESDARVLAVTAWKAKHMAPGHLADCRAYFEPDIYLLENFSLKVENLLNLQRAYYSLPENFTSDITAEIDIAISQNSAIDLIEKVIKSSVAFNDDSTSYRAQRLGDCSSRKGITTVNDGFQFFKTFQARSEKGLELVQLDGGREKIAVAWVDLASGLVFYLGKTLNELDEEIKISIPELDSRPAWVRDCRWAIFDNGESDLEILPVEKGIRRNSEDLYIPFFRCKLDEPQKLAWAKGWWRYYGMKK